MQHWIRISEAFQLVDMGRSTFQWVSTTKKFHMQSENKPKSRTGNLLLNNFIVGRGEQLPIFLYEPHDSRSLRVYLRDGHECPEKTRHFDDWMIFLVMKHL